MGQSESRPVAYTESALCTKDAVRVSEEIAMRRLMHGVLVAEIAPNGSIVDAGANSGEESCLLASWQPRRLVHAIDPSVSNVQHIRTEYATRLPNLRPDVAGLGERYFQLSSTLDNGGVGDKAGFQQLSSFETQSALTQARKSSHTSSGVFVHRLDYLLRNAWRGERLGFLHLDVEGEELKVLKGGVHGLMRDRPIFTTEVVLGGHAGGMTTQGAQALLGYTASLGYATYMIEEACGLPLGCRNLINVPKERVTLFERMPLVTQMRGEWQRKERGAWMLKRVDNASIAAHPASTWPLWFGYGCASAASYDACLMKLKRGNSGGCSYGFCEII